MQKRTINGLILRLTPLQEYDRIITLFSKEEGVIRIFAKGVRRFKSTRSFHLDLLNYVRMEVEESQKTTALPRPYLREVRCNNPLSELKKDPHRFAVGCMVASFIARMVPEASYRQDELYELTETSLMTLNVLSDPNQHLFTFLLKALRILGHLPNNISKTTLKKKLVERLEALDPQFTLQARRTLGTFSM
ncbi:DNA repair protein RecO [Candidatus Peregrinibacteria bacterium CG_4_9_14_0_2_um_filter_53_11]|nr:MAG: DNA repair protein RecO [Candidatus Peregrinibacteria bacterium CG_4_9_14_0_2_um_filter_53_11]